MPQVESVHFDVQALRAAESISQDTVYKMMERKVLNATGFDLGKKLAEQHDQPGEPTKILYSATQDHVTISLVNRTPQKDGSYETLMRVMLDRNEQTKSWHVQSFVLPEDPYEVRNAPQKLVDMVGGIRQHYKEDDQKFAADFFKVLAQGKTIWDAVIGADYKGQYDSMIGKAITEGNVNPMKIKDGRVPGQFEYHAGNEGVTQRATHTPVAKAAQPKSR